MKKETLFWQIIVFILGLFLILTVREYLLDKNEIEAETSRANCILGFQKLGDTNFNACTDIKTYKLKETSKGY